MNNNEQQLPTHITDFIRAREAGTISVSGSDAPTDPTIEARKLASTCTVGMVEEVEREIGKIEKRLAETNGFHRETGAPIYAIAEGSHTRKALEIKLFSLKNDTLPYTKHRAAEIEAAKASLPSQEELIAAELERDERIDARALQIVEELEAKQKAQRILSERQRRASSV